MVVGARSAGPFSAGDDFIDYYDEEGRDAWTVLQEALEGRNFIENPEFVDGSEGFGDYQEYGEWADSMFDMSWWKYNQDGARRSSKYCGNWERWGEDGFFAIWRYEQAYVADSFLIATANDCESNARRMGDGWTFSGANSADGPWTVLWEGLGSDYEPINRSWFRFDLEGNTEAFQYYRIFADDHYDDQDLIQLSNIAVTGAPAGDADDNADEDEDEYTLTEGGGYDEPVAVEQVAPTAAPPTFDPISIIALGALASATGVLVVKKRKN